MRRDFPTRGTKRKPEARPCCAVTITQKRADYLPVPQKPDAVTFPDSNDKRLTARRGDANGLNAPTCGRASRSDDEFGRVVGKVIWW